MPYKRAPSLLDINLTTPLPEEAEFTRALFDRAPRDRTPEENARLMAYRRIGFDTGLTVREERFCREYIKDYDVKRAAARAGYTPGYDAWVYNRILKRPKVAARIQELHSIYMEVTISKIEKVIERLTRLADKAEADEEYGPAIRAAELLGKHYGMFIEKSEIELKKEQMPTELLDQKISELLALTKPTPAKRESKEQEDDPNSPLIH